MTNIRFRRGNKADLPALAPSGLPLWCEDTKELYIGTDSGVSPVVTNNNYFPNFVPYCLNSGNQDSNGYADIINKVSNTEISFKIGGSYPNIGVTFPNCKHYTISSIANITGLSADGTYTFIIEEGNLTKLSDGTYSAIGTAVKLGYSYDGNNVIPVMTSDSSGGWTTSASSVRDAEPHYPAWNPYYACDGSSSTNFMSAAYSGWWKILKNTGTFTSKKIGIKCDSPSLGMRDFTIRDQDNNVLVTVTDAIWNIGVFNNYELPAEFTGTGIILNVTASYNGYTFLIDEVVIYEHLVSAGGNISEGYTYPEATLTYTPVIPTMTSNNSGGFIASGSAIYGGDYYKPFDGITGDAYPLFVYGSHSYVLDLEFNASKDNIAAYDIKHWDNYIVGWRIQFYYGGTWHIVDEQTGKNITATSRFYLSSPYSGVTKMRFSTAEPRPGGAFGLDLLQLYQTVSAFSQNGDYHTLVNQIPYKPQKRINGSWVNREYLKFGEDTKTGGIFGIPKSYAFNRKFYKKINCPTPNTITDIIHNIGSMNLKITAYLVNKASEVGYVVGQKANFMTLSSGLPINGFILKDNNTLSYIGGNQNPVVQQNGSPYYYSQVNPANWDLEIIVEGNF